MPAKETLLNDAVFDQLRRAMEADATGLTALYHDFLCDAWESWQRLRESVQSKQAEAIRAKAHYLKSSCLVLGAHEVAQYAGLLEQAAIASDRTQYAATLDNLKLALEKVQAELAERLGPSVLPANQPAA